MMSTLLFCLVLLKYTKCQYIILCADAFSVYITAYVLQVNENLTLLIEIEYCIEILHSIIKYIILCSTKVLTLQY